MISEATLAKIKELARLATESGISELSVEGNGFKLQIMNEGGTPRSLPNVVSVEEKKTNAHESGEKHIKAPMVGTFYRASSPDAPPLVEVGSVVDKCEIVCLIEAMKLFNEIEAEKNCKISKILVEDGKPVEYGQPLFLIEEL